MPPPSLPQPRLETVTPCGGRAGSSVELALAGTDLDGARALLFSHPGITAEPIDPPAAPKPGDPPPRFRVAVAADCPVGTHDLRVVNALGVSNPRAFVVGDRPEVLEREPNDDVDQAQRIELNTTVHGTIASAQDVDYYVFTGKKGQRVLASCLTSSIDSRLDVALELYDAAGRCVGFNRRYRDRDALLDRTLPADGDYHLRVYAFAYVRGDLRHYYRLTVGTGPWIDAAFPPVVEPGKPTEVTLYGRNLPGGRPAPDAVIDGRPLETLTVTVTPPADPEAAQRLDTTGFVGPHAAGLDGFEYRLHTPDGTSNPVLLAYATAPVVLEREPNDTPQTAQELPVPCEAVGRIDRRRDRDWYAFTAKKGEVLSLDLAGERLGAPSDFYLILRDGATGRDLGEFDDPPPDDDLHARQFPTRSSDPPRHRFVAPADGRYLVMVGSRDSSALAGPHCFYRLRVGPERPDFRLIVMPKHGLWPDATVLPRDGAQYFDVFVWRFDGFDGPVTLAAEGLPAGVSCPPQVILPGAKQGMFVLRAAADAPPWAGPVRVHGDAAIDGRVVRRQARAATITWAVPQPNVPAVARLDRQLVAAVRDAGPFKLMTGTERLTMKQGERLALPVHVSRSWADFPARVDVSAPNLPAGRIAFNDGQPLPMPPGGPRADATAPLEVKPETPPGTYSLTLLGQSQPFAHGREPAPKAATVAEYPAPPVTLTVLPAHVAVVSVAMPEARVKPGGQVEALVKVNRLFDYGGELRVKLLVSAGGEGVSAPEVTVPAGQSEVRMMLTAAPDAKLGSRPNLTVQATAVLNGSVPTTQEARFTLDVVP
jgi:hypothetical protein